MTVLAAAAALIAFGALLRLPRWLIGAMLLALWAGAVLVHLVLPDGAPLRQAVGGTARGWLALAVLVALALAYRTVLGRLRRRAGAAPPAAAKPGVFSDTELDRYARHIVLREVGGMGQRRLKQARVLVVGAGGLGSPAILYLAAAGVGTIGVIDDDTVSNSNLQRQIIHADARIGMPKVFSAEIAVKALNPFVTLRPYNRRLTAEAAPALFADYDLILDGSDNFDTRLLVNEAAVAAGKPLLSGAITQWEGQLSLYDPDRGAPCFACVFPEVPAPGLAPSCAEAGVMGALPGILGATMAAEAIKEITGAGQSLRGRLMLLDALWGENRVVTVRRRADCPVCGQVHPAGPGDRDSR
ncbi:HesA/MoeB/ThiF family protein [Frigidibacter oleivorans]|uniref:HesA/MoeB/ThiF family protein n=1 Tax=Frigidibacter oleivorans TaxID=2487129 RepID=UPI000F8E0BEF|nr:molybdopterin-synthase adenylyltransferase MoeB [Frigidibacter oleivorans]